MLDAFEKTTIGLPKKVDNRNPDTIRLVAYHEAGHTLIAKLFSDIFDLRKKLQFRQITMVQVVILYLHLMSDMLDFQQSVTI